ncbi:MAG: hypothetical protein ACI9WU_003997 [Myxococcota bacterium]
MIEMNRKAIARVVVTILTTVALMAGCSQVYSPAKTGWCKEGREWVPPVKQSDNTWKDGYCREKNR